MGFTAVPPNPTRGREEPSPRAELPGAQSADDDEDWLVASVGLVSAPATPHAAPSAGDA